MIFPAHFSTLSPTKHPSLYSPWSVDLLGEFHQTLQARSSCRVLVLQRLLPRTPLHPWLCVCLSPLAQREAVSEYPFNSRHSQIHALALFFLPSTHHEAHIIHLLDYFLTICLPQLEGKFQMIRVFVCLVCPYPKCPCIE